MPCRAAPEAARGEQPRGQASVGARLPALRLAMGGVRLPALRRAMGGVRLPALRRAMGGVRLPALCLALLLALSCSQHARAQSQPPSPVEGTWAGALRLPQPELWVRFRLWTNTAGALVGRFDSPDQQVMDLALTQVRFAEGSLSCQVGSSGQTFVGDLQPDGQSLVGEYRASGTSLPLTLRRLASDPRLRRPQEPARPYPYAEESVTFTNPRAGVRLGGTLTLPRSGGPFPAVLLVAGSGPLTRDEEAYGHRPFLVLADRLTRQGFAVLRYDKRGLGSSTGDYEGATTLDFADDALAGIEYLKTRPEVDPRRVGLIGHSEGACIGARVAAEPGALGFVVLLAGSFVPGEEVIRLQAGLLARAQGVPEEEIARQQELRDRISPLARSDLDGAALRQRIREVVLQWLAELPPDVRAAQGDPEALVTAWATPYSSPWIRFFLGYDPAEPLPGVACPVLALNGTLDLQVDPGQNLPPLRQGLQAAGNPDVTVLELPRLNHFFQTATTGGLNEYGRIEETLAPAALDTLLEWLARRAAAPGDVDADGQVTVRDVLACLRIAAGLAPAEPPDLVRRGDVAPRRSDGSFGDGALTVLDVLWILRLAAGLQETLDRG